MTWYKFYCIIFLGLVKVNRINRKESLKLYKKHFINNFIVDLELETNLDNDNYEKILDLLMEDFPIIEEIENKKVGKENKIKFLYNASQSERITIDCDRIIYEVLKYESFSNIKLVLEKIITSLKESCEIKNFNKIGLRYVNLIKMPIKNKNEIFDWQNYINDKLLFFNDFVDSKTILQQISTIDFKIANNLLCRLKFGIPNRNMPVDLVEKIFLVDIDCFTNSLVEEDEVMKILNVIHEKNIQIFEKCIEGELRRKMNE